MEEAETGGLKKFVYPKGHRPEKDSELENNIDEAYKRYHERKRRNRAIIISVLLAIVLAAIGYILLR